MNKLVVVPPIRRRSRPTQAPTVYMPSLDRAVSNAAVVRRRAEHLRSCSRTIAPSTSPPCRPENPNGDDPAQVTGRRVMFGSQSRQGRQLRGAGDDRQRVGRGLRARGREPAPADQAQRQADRPSCSWPRPRTSSSKSKDGTEVHGLIVKPAGYKAGTKYPTLLIIHGGPNGQDEHAFCLRSRVPRGQRLRRAGDQLPRQRRARQRLPEGDLRRLGQSRSRRSARRGRRGGAAGHRRSESPRHRRLELRRHLDQLRDRHRHALQGGRQRRRQLDAVLDVRRTTSTSSSTSRSWGRRGRRRTRG